MTADLPETPHKMPGLQCLIAHMVHHQHTTKSRATHHNEAQTARTAAVLCQKIIRIVKLDFLR